MIKRYTVTVLGIKKQLTVPQWFDYLKDKPIYKHYKINTMYSLLDGMPKNGLVVSQALGILDKNRKLTVSNKMKHEVPKLKQANHDLVNIFLRTRRLV